MFCQRFDPKKITVSKDTPGYEGVYVLRCYVHGIHIFCIKNITTMIQIVNGLITSAVILCMLSGHSRSLRNCSAQVLFANFPLCQAPLKRDGPAYNKQNDQVDS